ncbi:MAG TPA: VWA domain-containing protein [Candidatus Acidoferrales bacterium]|nr:VWA domain-containing protein [Candidatus Acidoferrales bacterium]
MIRKLFAMVLCSLLTMPALAAPQLPQGQRAPAIAPAQNQNGTQQGPTIRTVTNGVIVPVTVKNKQGQLVGDLQKDDFRVLVDGIEQKILTFTAEPVALAAIILIDNDLTKKQADEVQKSLAAISAGFGANDEAAVVTYSEYTTVVQEFTKNNDDLFTRLKRLEIGAHSSSVATGPTSVDVPVINGNTNPATAPPTGLGIPLHGSGRYQTDTALDDALYSAAGMFQERQKDRRKIVFLISDGSDSRQNRHTFNETARELLRKDVSVYSITVSHSVPVPVAKSIVERGQNALQKYAVDTGGDTFYGGNQPDLERLYSEVTEEARNQYTLIIQPSGEDKSHDFHPIEVRVKRPGLDIITRQGYYNSGIGR